MDCCLFGTKPLPEPMLAYCQLDSWEQISVTFKSEFIIFIRENAFEIVVCQNGSHFVQGEMPKPMITQVTDAYISLCASKKL